MNARQTCKDSWELNPGPLDSKLTTLPLSHHVILSEKVNVQGSLHFAGILIDAPQVTIKHLSST